MATKGIKPSDEKFDKDIFMVLQDHPDVLAVMNSMNQRSRNSLYAILDWPSKIIDRLLDDPEHMTQLHRSWDCVRDQMAWMEHSLAVLSSVDYDRNSMADAFSTGHTSGMKWLADVLEELALPLGRTWILCGWIGISSYVLLERKKQLGIENIRNFDSHPSSVRLSEILNAKHVMDDWTFKGTVYDVQNLIYDDFKYQTCKRDGHLTEMFESADTIINTSSDVLMSHDWFHKIPNGKLVVIQNNDADTGLGIANTVHSEFELIERYELSQILHFAKLKCHGYNRYMIVGYK